MKNKKATLFASTACAVVGLIGVMVIGGNSNAGIHLAKGTGADYSIAFDSTTNKIGTEAYSASSVHSGNGFAATALGNKIGFEYNSFYNPTTVWQIIKGGGYFTNTDPIHGMKSITIAKNSTAASLQVYWSETTAFDEAKSSTYDSTSTQTFTCDFGGYSPNYLKVVALGTSNSSIKNASILFGCANLYPTLAVTADHPEMGAVSGGGIHKIGSSVALTATPNAGYKFGGWYHDETLLSSDASYTFAMPQCIDSYAVEGHFLQKAYSLILSSEDETKGSVTGVKYFESGESLTITASAKEGYSFVGWYEGTTQISTQSSFIFTAPNRNLSYSAKFTISGNLLSLSSAEVVGTATPVGSCAVEGAGTFAAGTSVTILAKPSSGYGFLGWYNGTNCVSSSASYTFTMPGNKLAYTAKYAKKYHVSVSSKDLTKGTVSGSGDFPYSSSVSVSGSTIGQHVSVTWYDDDSTAVCTNPYYTFTMPEKDINLSADFYKTLSDTFTLGKYPQTLVENATVLEGLASAKDTDSDGYLEYGTSEYKKVVCSPCGSNYRSGSYNVVFAAGATHYFKVEPIEWRVLTGQTSATGLLVSRSILFNSVFYTSKTNRTISGSTVYPANYEYSTIRAMLNGYDGSSYSVDNFTGKGFFDIAFTESEKAYITTSLVSNSSYCSDTNDKMFLLSYQDLINTTFFTDNEDRAATVTDYASATGAYMSMGETYEFNGLWLSRSTNSINSDSVRIVDIDGTASASSDYDDVNDVSSGIRPALNIDID